MWGRGRVRFCLDCLNSLPLVILQQNDTHDRKDCVHPQTDNKIPISKEAGEKALVDEKHNRPEAHRDIDQQTNH